MRLLRGSKALQGHDALAIVMLNAYSFIQTRLAVSALFAIRCALAILMAYHHASCL